MNYLLFLWGPMKQDKTKISTGELKIRIPIELRIELVRMCSEKGIDVSKHVRSLIESSLKSHKQQIRMYGE